DVATIAREAERVGYEYCFVADEGLHPDVYACLAVVARETDSITIGAMTNGYTRHPAVTAAALATINELSGGRAAVTVLAGGSMVLGPMGIPRRRPFRVVADAMEVMRRLWSGATVTWQGATTSLHNATLGFGPQAIPIWVASRGPMLLDHAGGHADGVVMTVKPDLGAALAIVDEGAAVSGRPSPKRVYLGRVCYTPEMLEGQRRTLSFVLMDSPARVLGSLGFDEAEVGLVAEAAATNRPDLVDPMVTDDLLRRYQVAGSPGECADEVAALVDRHRLDVVMVDALSADLDENLALLHETYPIISGRTRADAGAAT
ncbi:MAG: LLM class flavin-dependent oxidoreductase, partial [Acidimicrobiales bacterium]